MGDSKRAARRCPHDRARSSTRPRARAPPLPQVDSLGDALSVAAALAASYVLSDLGTGIYHWSVDNYGDGKTPMFGRQIAAFQGHHQRPWTITQREFCNNLHQVTPPGSCRPVRCCMAVARGQRWFWGGGG